MSAQQLYNKTTHDPINPKIETDSIPDNGVTTAKINDGAITTAKLDSGAVTNVKLANNAVTGAKIADSSIGSSKLGNSAITTAKIANSAVTEDKLGAGAVTDSKVTSVGYGKIINMPQWKILPWSVFYATFSSAYPSTYGEQMFCSNERGLRKYALTHKPIFIRVPVTIDGHTFYIVEPLQLYADNSPLEMSMFIANGVDSNKAVTHYSLYGNSEALIEVAESNIRVLTPSIIYYDEGELTA